MNKYLLENIEKRLEEKSNIVEEREINTLIQELDIYHAEIIAQNEELIETNENLVLAKEEFSTLFFYAPICYFIIDKRFKIVNYNNKATEYFEALSLKSNFFYFINDSSKTNFLDWIEKKEFLENDLEIYIRCKDRELKRFRLKAVLHPVKRGFYFLSVIDIDQEYHLKIDLEKRVSKEVEKNLFNQELIQEKSRLASMGELLDIIAHQWNTPLANIKIVAELLKIDFEEGRVDKNYIDEASQKVISKIDHLNYTLTEFRNFLRPKSNLEKISLNRILQSVQIILGENLLKQKIDLIIDIPDNIFIEIYSNEFINVFVSLISNSTEAFISNKVFNKEIKISSEIENDKVFIYIEDNAGGIAPDSLEKVFDKEFTTKDKGTGVGLYLVQTILEKMNAQIQVKNVNSGCMFTISLKRSSNLL